MRGRVFNYAILAMILLNMGCGKSRIQPVEDSGISQPLQEEMPPLADSLPFPNDLDSTLRIPESISAYQKLGKERYRDSTDAVINGNDLTLMPADGALSWAIYSMGDGFLKDADALKTVSTVFSAPQPDQYFLAIANFETKRWQLLERNKSVSTTEEDLVDIPAGVGLVSQGGRCYVAVLLWDSLPATISTVNIWVDVNQVAPLADLSATPTTGNAALEVSFDASASYDVDLVGTIASYEWDWEGDGNFDETGTDPTIQHIYVDTGDYSPLVRVTDSNDGLTDTAQLAISVQGWSHSLGSEAIDYTYRVLSHGWRIYGAGTCRHPAENHWDGLLYSMDQQGRLRWMKYWDAGPTRQVYDHFYGMAIMPDGGVVVAGQTDAFSASDFAVLVVRFDQSGNEIWARTWDSPGFDYASAVDTDTAGNIYIAGSSKGFRLDDKSDGLLLKYSSEGDVLWEKIISNTDNTIANAIDFRSNSLFIAADADSYTASRDVELLKLDSAGLITADHVLSIADQAYVQDMQVDLQGNTFLTGYYGSTDSRGLLARVNSDGSLVWLRNWRNADDCKLSGIQLQYGPLFTVSDVYAGGSYKDGTVYYGCLLHYDGAGIFDSSQGWINGEYMKLTNLAAGSNGALLLGGTSLNNSVSYGLVTGSTELIAAEMLSGNAGIGNVSAVKNSVQGSLSDAQPVLDSGGGSTDCFVGCYYPEDF